MTAAYLTYALCFASLLLNALLIVNTLANRSDNSRDQRADRLRSKVSDSIHNGGNAR